MRDYRFVIAIIITAAVAFTAGGFIMSQANQDQSVHTGSNKRVYLEPYTGVGSGVFRHGTIVKIDGNDQPTVIGSFEDQTGATFPGTWVVREEE